MEIFYLIIGVLAGTGILISGRLSGFEKDRSFYPTLLIVIALYYVLFAFQSARQHIIITEVVMAALFTLFAVWGYRKSLVIAGVGLILHGVFDLFHAHIPNSVTPPEWWPMFCFGIDVVLGVWLIILTVKTRKE